MMQGGGPSGPMGMQGGGPMGMQGGGPGGPMGMQGGPGGPGNMQMVCIVKSKGMVFTITFSLHVDEY